MASVQGVLFSGTILIIISLLAFHLISYMDAVRGEGAQIALRVRSSEMSSFLEAIELDMSRATEIASKRALLSAVAEIEMQGAGLDDASVRMQELMINGTIYGAPALWMNDSTIPTWTGRVAVLGANRGFAINITILSLAVEPQDAFTIRAKLISSIVVNDSLGKMTVRRNVTAIVIIPLTGVEDPLYLLGTRGLSHRSIYPANFSVNGLTALDSAISGGYYMNNSDAPSFLDRLEGKLATQSKYSDLTENQIGIETFVNLVEIYSAGVDVKLNQTVVDHIYFSDSNVTGSKVNGSIHDWFRIDTEHAQTYGVDGLLVPG